MGLQTINYVDMAFDFKDFITKDPVIDLRPWVSVLANGLKSSPVVDPLVETCYNSFFGMK